jgi:RND family efflux transporter MFP subunit
VRQSSRRAVKFLVTLAVLGTIAIAAVSFARSRRSEPDDAAIPGTFRVVRRDVGRVVKATGVIRPAIGAEVRVGSRVSGIVERLRVRVGDRVRAGDVLAELDPRELNARRDDAAAALNAAVANFAYASAELARKRELAAERLIAPSELDLATRAEEVARREQERARANLTFSETQLTYARIVAPISGVVSSVATQEGETVAASLAAPTFLTLLDLNRLEVRAYVDETDIGRIKPSQRATFTVDTYGEQTFDGRVETIYPQAEIRDNVVNYVAVIRFPPSRDHVLRPEMTASVRLPLDVKTQVLAVPIRMLKQEDGRPFVMVREGQQAARRDVTLGVRDDLYCEIVDGLREGDEVTSGDAGGNGNGVD